jgi:hypothetical protein
MIVSIYREVYHILITALLTVKGDVKDLNMPAVDMREESSFIHIANAIYLSNISKHLLY